MERSGRTAPGGGSGALPGMSFMEYLAMKYPGLVPTPQPVLEGDPKYQLKEKIGPYMGGEPQLAEPYQGMKFKIGKRDYKDILPPPSRKE